MYHVRDRNVRYYAFTCYVTKACRTPLDSSKVSQTDATPLQFSDF